MRHVISGETSVVSSDGVDGLLRNLNHINVAQLKASGHDEREGVTALVTENTFPLYPASFYDSVAADCRPTHLRAADAADPLESMLVNVSNVAVTNTNPDSPADYNQFEVLYCRSDPNNYPPGLRVAPYFFDYTSLLANQRDAGDTFSSITGVLVLVHGNGELGPRSPADIVFPSAGCQAP